MKLLLFAYSEKVDTFQVSYCGSSGYGCAGGADFLVKLKPF
jgi:hypothetical protein